MYKNKKVVHNNVEVESMQKELPMIHFHVHSEYSFDGFQSVQAIFKTCKKLNQPAIAITDHNNLFAWTEMIDQASTYKIKPIFGIELNVENYHLIIIAENEHGLKNIMKLNNLAYEKNTSPFITEKELFSHKEGLFVLSGCSKGNIPSLLKMGDIKEAHQAVRKYKKEFGERFFIELQRYHPKQEEAVKRLFKLAKDVDVDVIPTNDVHYTEKESFRWYKEYVELKTNGKIYLSNEACYLKSKDEMKQMFPEKLIHQTSILSEKCRANALSLLKEQKGKNKLPLAKIYRYDEALAIRKILYQEKKFELGTFLYKQMKKEQMSLSDIYAEGTLKEEIMLAKRLVGKIIKIEKHPTLYIETSESFPYFKKRGSSEKIAQIEEHTATYLGFEIKRKKEKPVEMK